MGRRLLEEGEHARIGWVGGDGKVQKPEHANARVGHDGPCSFSLGRFRSARKGSKSRAGTHHVLDVGIDLVGSDVGVLLQKLSRSGTELVGLFAIPWHGFVAVGDVVRII